MFKVRSELCLDCGLCAEVCPRKAVSLLRGYAQIDTERCDGCRYCLEVCPQGAIIEVVPVSEAELREIIDSLKQKVDGIMQRLDYLIASRKEGK